MRRRRGIDIVDLVVNSAICLILIAMLFPVFARARNNARRSACQSNLKHLEVALWQYVADNNGVSPSGKWDASLRPYIKESRVFRCPSTGETRGASDYFFNARFLKKPLNALSAPQTLILMGDGDGSAALAQLPPAWTQDNSSPAWRHLDGANYGFADGHIKWLKPGRIDRNFRMVSP